VRWHAKLVAIAATIPTPGAGLAARLLAARTEANGGYLDLRDIELEALVLLVHAADSAYGRLTGEGARGGAVPAFSEGLRTQLHQLRDMLQAAQEARIAKR
jgi:hypothetical protein